MTTLAATGLLLQGCGGGGSSSTDTPAATTTTVAATTTTTLAALPPAAGAAIVGITVNSPPVVTFKILDTNLNHVSGLTLVSSAGLAATTSSAASAAALAADANCSGGNVKGVAIAKLVQPTDGSPSTWQNLISRQRYLDKNIDLKTNRGTATAPKYRYGAVEGTVDPLPTLLTTITKSDGTTSTGLFANPADAETNPANRIVGILKEDAAAKTYTYMFATDVTTPLNMADAVDVRNVSVGKVANNGQVLVKDGKTIYRIGLQLCYTDPVTKARSNGGDPTIDFTVDASGKVTVVTASDGKTPATAKKVVASENCQECHGTNPGHGGRGNTNYCVMCHNPGTTDFNTNNVLDAKIMFHRIHMGKELTQNYQVNAVVARYQDPVTGAVTGTGFPQDPRNCTKCHDNGKAAQADNWKNVPSRTACGSCHDGINFATGKGLTLGDAANGLTTSPFGHVGGGKADDTQCKLCHDATNIPEYHKTTIASSHNPVVKAGVSSFAYKISGVTIDSNRYVNVDFQILKDGTPVKFNTYSPGAKMLTGFTSRGSYDATTNPLGGAGPNFMLIYATGQDGIAAPSDWNSGHDSLFLNDLWAGNGLSVKDAATNTYTAYLRVTSTGIRGTTVTPGHTMQLPADAKMVTAMLKDSFIQDGLTDLGGVVPGVPAMMAATGNTPDGKPNVARRVIFDEAKCNTCHDRLGTSPYFHTGGYSIAMCAACHTPNQGGSTGWTASFRVWVHGIHGAKKTLSGAAMRDVPFTWHAVSKTDNYSNVNYPGVLKNCETCHLPGTYDFSASQYTAKDSAGKTIVDNMLYVQQATGKPSPTSATAYVFPQAAPIGSGKWAYGGATSATDSLNFKVDGVTDFGTGNSINPATNALVAQTTPGNNLVASPIAAACTACHDDATALTHITTSGFGSFYKPRSAAVNQKEQCLTCHGPAASIPQLRIKDAHNPATAPWSAPWY
ncbi:MAG: OmcA/MtrC family decaheme c-type cytochrome [Proteobacteria bacterium]|nr:OmcA/MtrC family decaheme c-type cytochrome [Pseudomonadota bacterium]